MKGLRKRKIVEYGKFGYLFIAPFFIVFVIFQLWPLIYTFWLSFQDLYTRGRKEIGPDFAGFQNFINIIVDKSTGNLFDTATIQSLGNTFFIWILNFVPQILLSLLLAAWLTDTKVKLKGTGAYKILIYMPNIITAASISVLFYSLFNNSGPITNLLRSGGFIPQTYNFMDQPLGTQGIIAFIQFWMWYGNTTLLLISGVLGISPSLFEAADIDGASGGKKFMYITLPLLKPILLYVLVTSVIGGLQMYDIPALFNVTAQGDALPDYASRTITMYIKQLAFGNASSDFGKSAAVSVVLFIITLIISMSFFYIMRDRDFTAKSAKKGEKQ